MIKEELESVQKFIDTLIEFAVQYSFSVIGALIVLAVGFYLAKKVGELVFNFSQKKHIDITLSKFFSGFVRLLIIGFAVIIALGKFGITITPLVAAISAMLFGASFAFQGPLSNYISGLTIIMTRPFIVGDTITIQEQSGVVEEVKLAATILRTEDDVRITIPNKHIVGEILHNSKGNRLVDGVLGISYADDPKAAIDLIEKTIAKFKEVTQDPLPQVGIIQFGESSINISYRCWVPTQTYYKMLFAINLAIHQSVTKAGITIPFPQRDVHMINP